MKHGIDKTWKSLRGGITVLTVFLVGCEIPKPGGTVIEPRVLGSVLDETNRAQEENADLTKFIIYLHEFEINLQPDPPSSTIDKKQSQGFAYQAPPRIRGIRLTPAGQDHVRQIARQLQSLLGTDDLAVPPGLLVTVERSDTSKRWDSQHMYPVHQNDKLDQLRRELVVEALQSLGITYASDIVVVAPASPTGLNAEEAAISYENTFGNSNLGNRAYSSGGLR